MFSSIFYFSIIIFFCIVLLVLIRDLYMYQSKHRVQTMKELMFENETNKIEKTQSLADLPPPIPSPSKPIHYTLITNAKEYYHQIIHHICMYIWKMGKDLF